jgi:aminocarboxymuconate-semialdehyde decarboxylase
VRVDVHSHLMPDAVYGRLPDGLTPRADPEQDEVKVVVEGGRGEQWLGAHATLRRVDEHQAVQTANGVDASIVSPWPDVIKGPLDPRVQHRLADAINEALAEATRDRPNYAFLAALPDLDGGRAAEALEKALELGASGALLVANPERGTLARSDLDALWSVAESRQAPVVLHPGEFVPPDRLKPNYLANLVANPFETTLAAASLLAARVPERFPHLAVVLVHGGGFLPYQHARISAGFERWPGFRGRRPSAVGEYLRWFYYDTVLFDDGPARYLLDVVGPDRVLAGSDCPFPMCDARPISDRSFGGLAGSELDAVLGENAVRLFNLSWAPVAPAGATDAP